MNAKIGNVAWEVRKDYKERFNHRCKVLGEENSDETDEKEKSAMIEKED